MKRPQISFLRFALIAGGAVVALVVAWQLHARRPPAPHVQIVLASDGHLVVAGIPGRSMRAQIQNPNVWDGSATTSAPLVEFLRGARFVEEYHHTFDGRIQIIVDDHASFLILKMLSASARTSYPTVFYINGTVSELPPQHPVDVDGYRPPADYLKDCTAIPPPPGCFTPPKPGTSGHPVH